MKQLNIHYFQHVPFEGLGYIEEWAKEEGHKLTSTKFYEPSISIPSTENIDWLIIMGGPMGPYDEDKYLWLKAEKTFIRQVINAGKVVIGFCLGGQLIADVLGANVSQNEKKEIGWYPVNFLQETKQIPALKHIADFNPTVFHWHQDTFDIPEGAIHIASSAGCKNQAFIYNNRVIGIQFHLESTLSSVKNMLKHCPEDYEKKDLFIQNADEILKGATLHIKGNNLFLKEILNSLSHEADFEYLE